MKKLLCLLGCLLMLSACSTNKKEEIAESTQPETQEKAETNTETDANEEVFIPSFSIQVCGNAITEKEMASYELVSFEVKTINSKGTEKNYKYTGYRITDVLKACGLNVSEGDVTATATDGYETIYKDNIILDTTLVAVLRDGEAFEEGPWLAPCSSETNGDYLKNLSEIKIAVE